MTTGNGSIIAAKPGQQVIYLLGEAGIATERRGGLIDAHGVCPERIRRWIFRPVGPIGSHWLAVLSDRYGLAGLDAGQNLSGLLVEFTGGRFVWPNCTTRSTPMAPCVLATGNEDREGSRLADYLFLRHRIEAPSQPEC